MLFKVKQILGTPLFATIISVIVIIGAFAMFFASANMLYVLILVVPLVLLSLISDYRHLFYLLIFLLPFSIPIRVEEINLNINFPSEAFIGLLSFVSLVLFFFQNGNSKIVKHPMSLLLFIYWLILVVSFIFSSMPMVSFKSLLVASCYLLVFYYLIAYYLITNEWKVKKLFFLYAFSLLLIVLFTIWKHSFYGFSKTYSGQIVLPFFSDHTIYGACLSFMVPVVTVLYLRADKLKLNFPTKIIFLVCIFVFLIGIYLSHSRATWISLLSMPLMLIILKLKISFKSLIGIGVVIIILALLNIELLEPMFLKNKNDSKAKRANLEEQIRSVTNVKNDVSNSERVNRWLCAYRMFKEKPFTGYGIGTYQFKYIPFQKGSEMTQISITSPKNNHSQGMGGTAHSEYLLALSESGIFASLLFILLFFYSMFLGMKLYYTASDTIKYYALMIMMGLLTYFIHGVFNNFLTTDKASFLVWGGLATLCALEIKHKRELSGTIDKVDYEKN